MGVYHFDLCVAMACSLIVADPRPGDEPPGGALTRTMTRLAEGRYLVALRDIEAASGEVPGGLQLVATLRSFVGDYEGALEAMDRQAGAADAAAKVGRGQGLPDDVAPVDAIEAIVERARDSQIVIVNEAHHVPRHRAFIRELARRLRNEGFEYYAAEAFSPAAVRAGRGYPVRSTGFYIMEPVFGELVREVLHLGYRPVAYEPVSLPPLGDQTAQINAREAGQCRNLVGRIFRDHPRARALIHVGYSHARETPQELAGGGERLWMAARLARETGIDPLTIDQTTQTERSESRLASPEWRAARARGWLDRPVLLLSRGGKPLVTGEYAGAVDLQVFHPPTRLVRGRPDWLAGPSGRRPAEIPAEIDAKRGPILVQAFFDAEGDDAVPADQVVLRPGEARPVLVLRPGRYRIVAQDERGGEVSRMPLVVE
jgi:hypothetical protein